MMSDPVLLLDGATFTILLVHVGLTIGTLFRHLHQRPDLKPGESPPVRYRRSLPFDGERTWIGHL